jgi:ABC-2 type transport system ATP-binding protein
VPAAEATRRADELLGQFGLLERADVKPDLFSGGQSQRMMIARALMHEPAVLFLDEPSTGLDPAARLFVWDRLRELRARGVTLMLTTHDMHEAATLADRVGIMDHGKLLALDTPEALMRGLAGSSTLELSMHAAGDGDGDGDSDGAAALAGALGALRGVEKVEPLHDEPPGGDPAQWRLRLYVAGEASQLVGPAATLLAERGLALSGVELGTPTLEDVFIALTGRTLR